MSAARPACFHSYSPVRSVTTFIAGRIGEGVLITDVVSDLFADGSYVFQRIRQESFAPRLTGQLLEYTRIAIFILRIKDADGIDNCVGLPGHGHDLGQAVFAGSVPTVADHDQHFLGVASLLQAIEAGGNRIV